MPLVEWDKFRLNGRAVENEQGRYVAELLESKKGDEILVQPKSGQGIRDMAKLTLAVAEANPAIKVGFDFSGNYYAVKPRGDSVTEIVIRYLEEPGIGRTKPGWYHDIARERPEALETSVSDKEGFTKLFDVLIDAIRLSRHNGGKAVEFAFNKHRMAVFAEDDAEELERMVPKQDRVTNIRELPKSTLPPEPKEKIGGYVITGASTLKKK